MQAIYPDLREASVFITGGGSGIGAALTEGFLAQGARVAFIQRSDPAPFCGEMAARHGRRPLGLRGDITETATLQQALRSAETEHGPVRILVNNAADDRRHESLPLTEGDWDALIAVNLRACFFAAQAVIPGMTAAGGGVILNLTSISYIMGNAGYPAYVAANSGLNGLTRALAREFGPAGIRVNALAPGWVMTEKQRRFRLGPGDLEAHLARQCLKEALMPEDLVGGALFLASGASRMMTGQSLVIDGGVVVTG